MKDVIIRNVTTDDINTLIDLVVKNQPLDLNSPYAYWVLTKYFSDECFILEINGKAEGFLTGIITPDTVFAWQMGINESFRGKDFAFMLFDKLIEVAKTNNLPISLTIEPSNRASFSCMKKYCDKNGYKLERNGECAISLSEELKKCTNYKTYETIYQIIY